MTNWQDPTVLFYSARAFVLFTHVAFGAYLWDFLSSLWFEWLYISGTKRITFPALVYFGARYTALAALTVGLVITNAMTPSVNCTAWNFALHSLAYTAVALSSLLLMLRVFAITQKNRYIMVIFCTLYAADWATIIYGTTKSSAAYIPELFLCAATNLKEHRPNTVIQFAFDLSCLGTMTVYLMRGVAGGSLWGFMISQGVIYFIVISIGYLLAIVFLVLDLNDAITQIPNVFALTVMMIFAQRMQRDLAEFYTATSTTSGTAHSASGPSMPNFHRDVRPPRMHPSQKNRIRVMQSTVVHTDRGNEGDDAKHDADVFPMSKLDRSHIESSLHSAD